MVYIENGETHFNEALLNYVKKGSISVLESFLRNDNSKLRDDMGRTLLHYAAELNNVSMTQHFIKNNYDVDAEDNHGETPLMLAVQSHSIDTAKLLIDANANMVFCDKEGNGILPKRPEFGKYKNKFTLLLKLGVAYKKLTKCVLEKLRHDFWNNEQLLISRLRDIDCSLIQAMDLGDANFTRLMLKNGYSIDDREFGTYDTALHKAVELADFENVKVLLENGARVGAKNKDDLSAIYFYDRTSEETDDKLKILKILIDHGALLTPPGSGMMPSEYIFRRGKLWAVNTLMQCNVEWNPQSLLYALVSNPYPDVLEVLRGKNIDVNSVDNPKKSPVLSHATQFGKLEKVKFLLEYSADPNVLDYEGRTPLINMFFGGFTSNHIQIIRLLLQHGADAQCSFDNGLTVFDIRNIRTVHSTYRPLLDPVIAHLAMIESRGETISDLIRSKIEESFKTQFETCKQQLEIMKNTVLYESVNLYKLLTESQIKITKYARNHELSSIFRETMEGQSLLDPHYSISLRKRVGEAIHLAKLKEEAVAALNNILDGRIKNFKEMLYEIVDYLSCIDLKNVCKVYDLQDTEPFY